MFPAVRLRRLRKSIGIRRMLSTSLPGMEKLVWPAFVIEGDGLREPIESMPRQSRLSIDQLIIDLALIFPQLLNHLLLLPHQFQDFPKHPTLPLRMLPPSVPFLLLWL